MQSDLVPYRLTDGDTTTGLNRKALVIKENTLEKGKKYIVQVLATDTGEI